LQNASKSAAYRSSLLAAADRKSFAGAIRRNIRIAEAVCYLKAQGRD
jgi:hypothetical protein